MQGYRKLLLLLLVAAAVCGVATSAAAQPVGQETDVATESAPAGGSSAESVPADSPSAAAVAEWTRQATNYSIWFGISLDEGSQRLATDLSRYHHPNPVVDGWYWHVMEAGWPAKSWPWVAAVMHGESRGNQWATSRHRDRGLLQVNQSSWQRAGRSLGLPWQSWAEQPEAGLRMALYVYSVQGRGAWVADRRRFPDPQLSREEAGMLFYANLVPAS